MATKAQVHRAVDAHFEAASAAAKLRQKRGGLAAAVTYEPRLRRLRIELTSGVGISVPVQQIQGLENALPGVVKSVEITGKGTVLYWPTLDLDVSVTDLVAGCFGSRAWMSILARQGGRVTSSAKAVAARNNGKKGGRPRKNPPQSVSPDLRHYHREPDTKAKRLDPRSTRARVEHAQGKATKP